jgi:hypothetical protein
MAKVKCPECGQQSFECGNCSRQGCQTGGCDKQQFVPIDKCKDCGRSYEMRPARKRKEDCPPTGATQRPRPARSFPIEYAFGAVLLTAAAIAAGLVLMRLPDAEPQQHAGIPTISVSAPMVDAGANAASLSVATYAVTNVCDCFDGGRRLAGTDATVLSSSYRVGFVQCRAALGPTGGDAWTAGWNARHAREPVAQSCRAFKRGRL